MNENYTMIKQERLDELDGTGYLLRHNKTGAKVVVISNQDDNKVFQIGFKTPPKDDTGVPHILEHSVLCGSREFPMKDPFVELVKGSLNTFLNAMTYPDKTVYPVASQNDKDFFNLVHVYLDAVFYPNIYQKPEILKQEGWHYDLESEDAPLHYNGVVFNEMKGVFSSPDQQLARVIQKSLLPDTPYGFESGGDPAAVPDLTYEGFLDFHRTYYHPSNSYIYLYGDMDPEPYLEFIHEHYLKDFDEKEITSSWKMQEPFEEVKRVEEFYPIGENDSEEEKTYFAYNAVIGTSLNRELYLAFQILNRALFTAPGAPVKKALMDAQIGKDVSSSYDNGIWQPIFSIEAQEAREDQEKEFVSIIEENLQKIAEEGIPKRSLTAAFNFYEFRYKEANFGRFPKGLMYGLQMYDSWLYDEEQPFIHIKTNEVFEILREKMETGYFEDLITKYLLENPHKSIVVMKPKKGLQKEKDQQEAQKLKAYKDSLSKEQIEDLVKETKRLKEIQETPSTKEELAKIPVLDIEDIRKEIKPLSNQETEIDGVKVLWHSYFTNQICYLKLSFDMSYVPIELAPYASLLTEVLMAVDTEKRSYLELGNEVSIETGAIAATMDVLPRTKDEWIPLFSVKTKCFYPKTEKAFALMEEIIFESKLNDKKRLKEIIGQIYTNLKMQLTEAGHKTAANRAISYFSSYAKYKEAIQGIDMFESVKNWYENFEESYDQIAEGLETARKMIFQKQHMIVSYTGNEKEPEFMEESLGHFVGRLYPDQAKETLVKVTCDQENEGFATAGGVCYVACAGNFMDRGFQYTGALRVLQMIFSYEYLWIQLRVKGGAYGCMCSFGSQGDSMFVTYRDPNLKETYDVYDRAYQFVETFDPDARDMKKYIIGTISGMDMPMGPDDMGARSFQAYLMGKTEEEMQKDRDQVLGCTKEDIQALAPLVKAVVDAGNRCCVGNEDKMQQAKDCFDVIRNVL